MAGQPGWYIIQQGSGYGVRYYPSGPPGSGLAEGPYRTQAAAQAAIVHSDGTKPKPGSGGIPDKKIPPVGGDVKRVNEFVRILKSAIGDQYQFGAAGPNRFDCSGLVYWALAKMGINFPRTSEAQYAASIHINRDQLEVGDLVFSQWPGDNASPGHVQVYIGHGKVIQAAHPGTTVSVADLSQDTGHIVGYGRIPHLDTGNLLTPIAGAGGGSKGPQTGALLSEAGTLLHGIAEALDWAFGFFAPGQGWRIAFGGIAIGSGYGAGKAYLSGRGSSGGSEFPLAVGLAGVALVAAFMALRPWPQEAGGSEKPGRYVAEILSGQPPPPGPRRVSEVKPIEAGLAVFAGAWLVQKAASGIGSIINGIASFLGAAGLAGRGGGGGTGEIPPIEAA